VVAALLALSIFESLSVVRDAFDTAVRVSAGAERLEELDVVTKHGDVAWPIDSTVRLENLTIAEEGETLVSDASLIVAPGRRVALTGPSGIGKSTLLRALAALDAVASGFVTIGNVELSDIDEVELRRCLAYVASEPGLTRGFALDVVNLGRTPSRSAHDDLGAMGLAADSTTRWDELSRGERARIAITRAMVTSPLIYLLDEPTSGLGTEETAAVLSLLASTGATVMVATHDPQVMAWCDVVLELSDGALREIRH
jgi:ABC-type transport system involved in cytochrome bd biosynthesis fused ATPase/permease subunit